MSETIKKNVGQQRPDFVRLSEQPSMRLVQIEALFELTEEGDLYECITDAIGKLREFGAAEVVDVTYLAGTMTTNYDILQRRIIRTIGD